MKLNQYHKQVLGIALDVFEQCADDAFLDVRDNSNLNSAFNELKKASTHNVKSLANKKTVQECLKSLGS